MISLPIQHIPVPMFLLNKDNEIIEFTPSVTKNFPPVQNFLDLVDEDSQEKVKRALQGKEEVQIEVNMRTFSNPVALLIFILSLKRTIRCMLFSAILFMSI